MIERILDNCNERYKNHKHGKCEGCSSCCTLNCEECLRNIHYTNVSEGEISRKYDCIYMADYYTCKYAYRYTSEIIYALKAMKDIRGKETLKVLSLGCGPCTDLFALLHIKDFIGYSELHYIGVDYSEYVWSQIHNDIKSFSGSGVNVEFFYEDICEYMEKLKEVNWVPDLIVFQYVFSDMQKHTMDKRTSIFITSFAQYFNEKVNNNSYILLNDINLGKRYGGGREYFDQLLAKMPYSIFWKGYFNNDHKPNTYIYGECYKKNKNFFSLNKVSSYNPYNTCASAQMIIKKRGK